LGVGFYRSPIGAGAGRVGGNVGERDGANSDTDSALSDDALKRTVETARAGAGIDEGPPTTHA
jgi:hypothetical protein